jgi:hypothetical protein
MKKITVLTTSIVAFVTTVSMNFSSHTPAEIPYPTGFRGWTHIKTAVTGISKTPQGRTDGFHSIYANKLAMEGYKTGHFPDGSIIVFDKHAADSLPGVYKPGERKFVDVMFKDSKLYAESGGWGFEEFSGNSKTEGRLTPARRENCFKSCHQHQKESDFVFTKWESDFDEFVGAAIPLGKLLYRYP